MTTIDINLLFYLVLTKKKCSKWLIYRNIKTGSLINNPLFVFNTLNKDLYIWERYKRLYKYRDYKNREYEIESYTKKKWQVDIRDLGSILVLGGKIIHTASVKTSKKWIEFG